MAIVTRAWGQTDTARYVFTWTVPPSDTQHPPALFYHVGLILGDTTPKGTVPTPGATGVTGTYANTVAGLTWSFPFCCSDTLRLVRPVVDSIGPYRLAIQSGVGTYPTAMVLGPWVMTAAWWVKAKGPPAGQPYPPLGLAVN